MTPSDLLADAVAEGRILLERYLAGFDDANRTKQPPGLPNHAAWQLGHLALNMHRVAERLDLSPLPEADFVTGDGRAGGGAGGAGRFDTESVCFASGPVDDPALYPDWERCVAIFRAAASRLEGALRNAGDGALDRAIPWGRAETTIATLAMRMVFHNGTHAGQIVDLRRALGMKGVIG